MDLREKLERLGVHKGTEHLREAAPRRRGPGVERVAPGRVVSNDLGEFFLIEERFPLSYRHGDWALAALLDHAASDIQPLAHDASLEALDFSRAIFIDTETTGLAGGTGTYAFLVGIGYMHGGEFCLLQFFMRDLSEEPAMMAELARVLTEFSSLVSFNGRSFDWPLLETRFIMTRQRAPMSGAPHLDLLHLARRLWRTRLSSCALGSLEENILGVQRDNEDVPGWMVPQIYFQYLRDGDASPLSQVFYHNAQDILSLVTLSAYLAEVGRDPFQSCLAHGEDFYSLARFLERTGDSDGAVRAYQHAITCPLSAGVRQENVQRLSLLHKRLGRRDEAVRLWLSQLATGQLYPYVELAKHYEHHIRDYGRATELVQEAIALVRGSASEPWRKKQDLQALSHRLARLHHKLLSRGQEP